MISDELVEGISLGHKTEEICGKSCLVTFPEMLMSLLCT